MEFWQLLQIVPYPLYEGLGLYIYLGQPMPRATPLDACIEEMFYFYRSQLFKYERVPDVEYPYVELL